VNDSARRYQIHHLSSLLDYTDGEIDIHCFTVVAYTSMSLSAQRRRMLKLHRLDGAILELGKIET
jgi:hypothetical protein